MSFDDAATLAYLAEADRHGLIDLDAVTVSLSGAGYTGRGLGHARCLLRKHGLRGVPVSDGDALGANPLPEAIRSYGCGGDAGRRTAGGRWEPMRRSPRAWGAAD